MPRKTKGESTGETKCAVTSKIDGKHTPNIIKP